MASIAEAPASIRGWVAAERSADPTEGRRAVLSPDIVFDHGPFSSRGVDGVLEALAVLSPAGWLGDNVTWSLLPADADGRVTVRATSADGGPLHVRVPGDVAPREPMNAMDMIFTLDGKGLIVGIEGKAHHIEARGVAPPLRVGETAPDFVLPDTGGIAVPLRGDGAKATVVVFTCNNCPFAMAWHDRIQQVARDYAPRGVRVLQINPDDPAVTGATGQLAHSRKLVAEGHFAGPYLIDEGQAVARRWGARHTPEVFVLDAQGIVAYHGAPDADVSDESLNAAWLRGALDHVLAGTAADPAETQPMGCSIKWTH